MKFTPILAILVSLFVISPVWSIRCIDNDLDGFNISGNGCNGFSSCVNFTNITFQNIDILNLTVVTVNVTVNCNKALSYIAFSLPSGKVASWPADDSYYYSYKNRKFEVENPTNNPFYSIKFNLESNNGNPELKNGEWDVLSFGINKSYNFDFFAIQVKAGTQTYLYNTSILGECILGCGIPDCNDSNYNINPDMIENCSNSIDDNCDGLIDYNDPNCYIEYTCDPNLNLIFNGGFERPIVTNPSKWDIFPNGTPTLRWNIEWQSNQTSYKGVTRPDIALIELQRLPFDWIPAEGYQYAELDSDWDGPGGSLNGEPATIKIYQNVKTIPNATYLLTFSSSPRPLTNSSNNILELRWDDSVQAIISKNSSIINWSYYAFNLTATKNLTKLQFAELGIPDSLGTFLDNVSLRCIIPPPRAPVLPILECVDDYGNGSYLAHFGYDNKNNYTIIINISAVYPYNKITGGGLSGINHGQPEIFLPGRTPYYPNNSFNVLFDGTNLVWTLTGPDRITRTATASANSTRCIVGPIINNYTILSRTIEMGNSTYIQVNVTDPINVSYVQVKLIGPIFKTFNLSNIAKDLYEAEIFPPEVGNYTINIIAYNTRGYSSSLYAGELYVLEPLIPPPLVTCQDIYSLGLSSQPGILSPNKVLALKNNVSYYCAKVLLGLWDYDFYLELRDSNDQLFTINGEEIFYGKQPPTDASVGIYTRPALIPENGTYKQVKLTLGVWISR